MKILRPEEITTFPESKELSPEELKEAYALARAAFTADDLQRYLDGETNAVMRTSRLSRLWQNLEAILRGHRG